MLVPWTVLVAGLPVFTYEEPDFFCSCMVDLMEEAPGLAARACALALVDEVFVNDTVQLVDCGCITLSSTAAEAVPTLMNRTAIIDIRNNVFFILPSFFLSMI